jgi:AcrR family transcriptional regulator
LPPTTPRRREHSDAILAGAVAAFRRHGYHGTSMREIAGAVRRTKGSLYYYFASKAEILEAAHDRALDRMLAALARIERNGAEPSAQLRELVTEHVRAIVDGFHGTALALELDALPAASRRRLIAKRDRFERGLRRILARCAGTAPESPRVRLAGFALLGAINWLARWYRPEGPMGLDAIGRFFADVALAGLHAETESDHEPALPTLTASATRKRRRHVHAPIPEPSR